MINRRNLLKLGALAGAAAFVPLERLTAGPASAATVGPDVPLFAVPLSIPPVLRPVARRGLVDYYDVTMREADVEILPGTTTPIWGYNGSFPGPTIKVRTGRPVVIRQHNRLPEAVAVHLHGRVRRSSRAAAATISTRTSSALPRSGTTTTRTTWRPRMRTRG